RSGRRRAWFFRDEYVDDVFGLPACRACYGQTVDGWIDRDGGRLGDRATVSRLCRVFSIERGNPDADADDGGRTRHPKSESASELYPTGTRNVTAGFAAV